MSVSTEHEHVAGVTDFSAVTISGSWFDTVDDSKVGVGFLMISWTVIIHGRRVIVSESTLTKLFLSHLSIVCIETFICVFDDKGVLHLNTCWAD